MTESYPRVTLAIEVTALIGVVISAWHEGIGSPTSIFFIGVAALALLIFILWGLNTAVVLTKNHVLVEFDDDGNATISKHQGIIALRRTVSRLDERIGSEGDVVLQELEVEGIRSQYVVEQESKITSKVRQVLRTDLPVFRPRRRVVKLRMERSFCGDREWFELEMPYYTIDYKLALAFHPARTPTSIEVYRKKGSAELGESALPVVVGADGKGPCTAVFHRRYLSTAVLYRCEWNWASVRGGKNDGLGTVTKVTSESRDLPRAPNGPKSLLAGPDGTA